MFHIIEYIYSPVSKQLSPSTMNKDTSLLFPLKVEKVHGEERPDQQRLLLHVHPVGERQDEVVHLEDLRPAALPLLGDVAARGRDAVGGEDVERDVLAAVAGEVAVPPDLVADRARLVHDAEVAVAAGPGKRPLIRFGWETSIN